MRLVWLAGLCFHSGYALATASWSPQRIFAPHAQNDVSGSRKEPFLTPSLLKDIEKIQDEWGIKGIGVAIVRLPKKGADGWNDVKEAIKETHSFGDMTDHALFCIASNTKLFTAISTLSALPRRNLTVDTRIADLPSDLLPELSFKDRFTQERITIADMLSHASGLPRHDNSYGPGLTPTLPDLIKTVQHLRPSSDLRHYWQYQNTMFCTAALLISRLAGVPFTQYVAEHSFKNAGMNTATFRPWSSGQPIAPAYITLLNKTSYPIEPFRFEADDYLEVNAAAGGIFATVHDMAAWLAFGLAAFRSEDPLAKEATKTRMLQQPVAQWPEQSIKGYGLGVASFSHQGTNIFTHGGAVPGYGSQVAWVPGDDEGLGVAVLCNSMITGNFAADAITYRIIEEILGLEKIDWSSRIRDALTPKEEETRSDARASPLPTDAFLGEYSDLGYGNATVCPGSPTDDSAHVCRELYKKLDGARSTFEVPSKKPDLLIVFPRLWVDYFALWHHDDLEWRGQLPKLVPPHADRDFTLIATDDLSGLSSSVRFVLDPAREAVVGMEWRGVWGAGTGVPDSDEPEVIFEKR